MCIRDRSMKAADRVHQEHDRALLARLKDALEGGTMIRSLDLSEDERRELTAYQFVTRRPVLLVINIGEVALTDVYHQQHGPPGHKLVRSELAALVLAQIQRADHRAALQRVLEPSKQRPVMLLVHAI